MTGGFWYLASPYSKYPEGREAAFRMACVENARLFRAGIVAFSPIAHSHPMAAFGQLQETDAAAFAAFNRSFCDSACGMILLEAPGWRESVGIAGEIETFRAARKPIISMFPGEVPACLLPRST